MNWIRFDAQRPPEDTTVMVSNGPAMGHYHYVKSVYEDNAKTTTIPLWSLDGKRADVPLSSVIQWAHMLPVKAREIKKVGKWQSIKSWLKRSLSW